MTEPGGEREREREREKASERARERPKNGGIQWFAACQRVEGAPERAGGPCAPQTLVGLL